MIQFFDAMSLQQSDASWLHRALQIGLHSTLLLAIGFLAIFLLRQRGAVLQALVYRVTLAAVTLSLLFTVCLSLRFESYISPPLSFSLFSSAPTEQLLRSRTVVVKTWPQQMPVAREPQTKIPSTPPGKTSDPIVISSEDPTALANPTLKAVLTTAVVNRVEVMAYRLWLAGVVCYFTWLLACHLSITVIRRHSREIADGEMYQLLHELCRSMKLRPPLLLANAQISSPFLTGLRRAVILVPEGCESQFSPSSLRIILIHELTHLKRCDLWWSSLASIMCGLLWPQPLLWMLSRRMQAVNEEICDQAVLDEGCAPQDYASNLLDWAERLRLKPQERAVGLGVIPIRSTLGRRVQQILNRSGQGLKPISLLTRSAVGLSMAAVVVVVLVSFAVKAKEGDKKIVLGGPLAAGAPWPEPQFPKRDPFVPQSQTINGVTMRLTRAAWVTDEVFHSSPGQKHFALWYELESADARVRPAKGKTLADYLTTERAFDPTGRRVGGGMTRTQKVVGWDGVDPRWPTVPVEFEFLDPSAPAAATGEFEESLLFKDVPLPDKANKIVHVNRSLTTANGTRVFLEKLAVRPNRPGWDNLLVSEEAELVFVVRWEPPENVPDLAAGVSLFDGSVIDNTGKMLAGPHVYGTGQMGGDQLVQQPEQPPLTGGRSTLMVRTPPSSKAKSLDVKLQVRESALSLKQEKWLRRFRFEIPMQNVPFELTPQPARPVAVAEDKEISAELESIRTYPNGKDNGWTLQGRLWLRDRQPNHARQWRWVVENGTARDEQNTIFEDYSQDPVDSAFWKANHTPVRQGENGEGFSFTGFEAKRAPQKVTLEFEAQAESRANHTFEFTNLPFPTDGKITEINQGRPLPSGARLIMRQIGYFTEDQGTDFISGEKRKPITRFGISYEYQPATGSRTSASYRAIQATDDKGRLINQGSGLLASGTEVYLRPPAADAKSMNVRLSIEEVTLGPKRTVVFHNLDTRPR